MAYLHGLKPPIVHRDIKPDNILVQSRHAGYIHVKFGDFGLSRERRESGHWKTICGTFKYAAPEILEIKEYHNSGGRMRKRYTAVVDIWSLGVVMFKLLCGLPRYTVQYEHQGALWGEKILKKLTEDLRTRPNDVLQFLSTTMLILEPGMRDSAQKCYDGALRLSGGSEAMLQTPMPAPCVEDQQATVRHDDEQTVIFRNTEAPPNPGWTEGDPIDTAEIERYIIRSDDVGDSIDSAEIQRYIRLNNPPSTSQRRRSGRVSKLSTATHSRRIGHGQLAAESEPQRNEDEFDLEFEHCYQDPANSLCLGSSLSALERVLPSSWNQSLDNSLPQGVLGSVPNLVVGGVGYAQDEPPVNSGPGQNIRQPWSNLGCSRGAEGPSRREGKLPESEGHAVQCTYDDDQAIATALLKEIQGGN